MGAKRATGLAFALMLLSGALAGCAEGSQDNAPQIVEEPAAASSQPEAAAEQTADAQAAQSLSIQVDDAAMTIELADTDAARELASKASQGDITVDLHPYGGFEQVGELPWTLPRSNRQVTTEAGDVMLYQGNQIAIFHGSNSWAYTPLGQIVGYEAGALGWVHGDEEVQVVISDD
ncbi:cyclophilin-like fold protein [uncultured Ellagibacter sp.]|uniref:cyclophilin-like fold protein n=1 Tax=uncultured Ellagibacter sp. TaxID=2137580 RepID=UPI00261C3EAF|nr:cyclophilin-like fold protein [uncultured Ellagibacter sp.]